MNLDRVLLKRGVRSDSFWTRPFAFRYLARLPFFLDVHALMASQYWPRAQLDSLQDARIRDTAVLACAMPFWADRFRASAIDPRAMTRHDVRRLPVTSKADLVGWPVEEYTRLPKYGFWYDQTSGSTGKPFAFVHDNHYALRSYAVCERMFRAAGKTSSTPLITIRARWRPGVLKSNGYYFFLKGFTSLKFRLRELVDFVRPFGTPIILQSFSSVLIELARLAEEKKTTLPLRSVIATGEGLSSEQRGRIAYALHTDVYMGYTTRELGWLGFECAEHRMHINEEWAYVEVVDESGMPLPDGREGRILVTTFDNRVMPFIRYMTGDLGTIATEPCPCGRTLKTIRIAGRNVEIISLPEGRTVSLLDVAGAFDVFWRSLRQYQIAQRSASHFHVTVVPLPPFEGARQALEEKLISLLHPTVRITWETVNEIPESVGGKAVYFVRQSDAV